MFNYAQCFAAKGHAKADVFVDVCGFNCTHLRQEHLRDVREKERTALLLEKGELEFWGTSELLEVT